MIKTSNKTASGIVSHFYHMYGLWPDITVCSLAQNVNQRLFPQNNLITCVLSSTQRSVANDKNFLVDSGQISRLDHWELKYVKGFFMLKALAMCPTEYSKVGSEQANWSGKQIVTLLTS